MAVALAGSAFGAAVSPAPRCLLVNEDNDHFFKLPSSWMDRAGLLRYLDEVLQGPVTHFVMCVNGQRTSYASETWEPIWTGIGEPARKDTATHPDGTHDRWAVNAKRLFDQGIDPYEVWIGECRKRGVEAWVSMRMNDYHFADVTNYFRNTTFCRTRRDLWVEQSPKTWAGHALDYAKKEVRDYSLRQIREMCRRWDADGIELDWMRSPPHFRKGAGRANAAVLTAFMREVRAETERVGKARNRKYKLAVRVPPTPGESSETGIDVTTWLREGLVDAIVPSNLFCPDPTLPIGEWGDLVREANPSVELYPCVNCFHHTSAASIRASAAAYLGARVDGIYLFNAPYVGKRDTDGRKHKEDSFGKICREGLFPAQASVETADAVIVGSTPAGISAAVQLARMGKKAIVLSPTDRIGGMTTSGLGRTDVGRPEAFGGIACDFYRSVSAYATGEWSERTQWCFSPSAALRLLEILEKRERLDIRRGERIDRSKVKVEGERRRIVSVLGESGTEYRAKVFIDATYEGDLMAAAGVSYVVGREGNAAYGETINGAQPGKGHHRLAQGIDPYVVRGDKSSGLLPGVEAEPMGAVGAGDGRLQAYCYRLCLTDVESNRVPFAKPADYDEREYEILFRHYECGAATNEYPFSLGPLSEWKCDANNTGGVSFDWIGHSARWPEASYAEREEIAAAHRRYQQGLLWTLANHPRVPRGVRDLVSKWGLAKDEFADSDHWPRQIYVREARRMVGEYVMTEHACRGTRRCPRPVACGAYQMDSHHCRRYVGADGFVHNEGDVQDGRDGALEPYGIDYLALVPKRGECANLLVPVCLSASHIAYGSLRMEPVFFALGQAAGTAAALALDAGCAMQDVDYEALRARLAADGQVLPKR